MSKILVLQGPNLNLLGTREPSIYGSQTLADIQADIDKLCRARGHKALHFQSNAEHELVNAIQNAKQDNIEFIVINAAALTHTSVALRDALSAVGIAFIECHLSNVYSREAFRHHSYLADIAIGVISGFGAQSYELALIAAFAHLEQSDP